MAPAEVSQAHGRGRGPRFSGRLLGMGLWWSLLLAVALYQRTPGYMDEAYYWVVGRTWATGQGLNELFLWQYLDDPAGLPHPAGAYWQPLPALLAGLSIAWPRLPFLLLAGLLPWLIRALARSWGASSRATTWAGLWAMVPGFYLAYLPAIDGFTPLLVLGALYWILWPRAWQARGRVAPWVGLGLLSGLIHLARAEGMLWLLGTGLAALLAPRLHRWQWPWRGGGVLLGYLAVIGPWWWRNTRVWGTPWPPGQSRALWFTTYNDLFHYPAAELTPARWWAQGWAAIVRARLHALGLNLQTALAVQMAILLAPFVVVGFWHWRRRPWLRAAAGLYAAVLALMTLVFPFAGARGGFFHAASGLQPVLWVLAGVGYEQALSWAATRRQWDLSQARRILGGGFVLLLALLTLTVSARRLARWNQPATRYRALWRAWQQTASQEALAGPVLVTNPPLWVWVSGQPALVTPTGAADAMTRVARRYGARGLVVEAAHPDNLAAWWEAPGPRSNWRYLGPAPAGDGQLYEFTGGRR